MSRKQCECLKGVAILMVLTGHGCRWLTACPWQLLNWAGAIGVAIFLFLSGFGLMESYRDKGIQTVKWWRKRICKVMVPFWIMMILQTILLWKIGIVFKFKDWIISFLGYVDYDSRISIDSTMWYITFLMLQYLMFYLIFIIPMPEYIKIIVLCVIYIIGYNNQVALVSDWNINYFTFLLGIICSYLRKTVNIKLDVLGMMAIIVLLGISTGYFNSRLPNNVVWQIYALSGLISCVFITSHINEYNNTVTRVLQIIGKYSYHIYLVEGIIIIRLKFIYVNGQSYSNLFYFFVFSIASGYLYFRLIDYLLYRNRPQNVGKEMKRFKV